MFKEVFQHLDLAHLGEAGLVLFFLTFVATTVWAMTRGRKDVDRWSALPLEAAGDPAARSAGREEMP